jgi:hypothetical protein
MTNLRKLFKILLTLALLGGSKLPAVALTTTPYSARFQPAFLQLASQDPAQTVRVIVQAAGEPEEAKVSWERLSGRACGSGIHPGLRRRIERGQFFI